MVTLVELQRSCEEMSFQKDIHHCNTPPIWALFAEWPDGSLSSVTHESLLGFCKKHLESFRCFFVAFFVSELCRQFIQPHGLVLALICKNISAVRPYINRCVPLQIMTSIKV